MIILGILSESSLVHEVDTFVVECLWTLPCMRQGQVTQPIRGAGSPGIPWLTSAGTKHSITLGSPASHLSWIWLCLYTSAYLLLLYALHL